MADEEKKQILIIEDDSSIAELERDYLEISDFSVTIIEDGEKGLREALGKDYDLVILDLMLPGVDGFEICRRIREKRTSRLSSYPQGRTTLIKSMGWASVLMTTSRSPSPHPRWLPASRHTSAVMSTSAVRDKRRKNRLPVRSKSAASASNLSPAAFL